MYVCPQIQKKSQPTPIFVTWAILTLNIDLAQWLRLQYCMHSPGSNPGQVTYVTDYLLPSARLDSMVKAARNLHAQLQIPDKSLVPCDCLLPFLALTSITDLTQWLRLQDICTPQVQIPDTSCGSLFTISLHALGSNPSQVTYGQLFFTHLL